MKKASVFNNIVSLISNGLLAVYVLYMGKFRITWEPFSIHMGDWGGFCSGIFNILIALICLVIAHYLGFKAGYEKAKKIISDAEEEKSE